MHLDDLKRKENLEGKGREFLYLRFAMVESSQRKKTMATKCQVIKLFKRHLNKFNLLNAPKKRQRKMRFS